MKLFIRPLHTLHDVAIRQVVKQFADIFDFVYFGRVDTRTAEHQLVYGVTAAAKHRDDFYAFGTFRNYDCIILERRSVLHYSGHEPHAYRWMLLQLDLHRKDLPHIFIAGHRYEEQFYETLFTAHAQFTDTTQLFTQKNQLFVKHFSIFAAPADYEAVQKLLTEEITQMLAHHFAQFDYEFQDDHIIICAKDAVVTMHSLREMLRVGAWLADSLDNI